MRQTSDACIRLLRFLSPPCCVSRLTPSSTSFAGIRATVEELRLAKSTINSEKELIVEAVDQLAEQAVEVGGSASVASPPTRAADIERP